MPLVIPAARGSSSDAVAEVSAPTEEGQKDVAPEEAYLELADPDEGTTVVWQSEEEVVMEQPKKVKKKRLMKQSDVLPAKKLRVDHPTLVSGTGGKTLAGLEQMRLAGSRLPDREQLAFCNTLKSEHAAECLISSTLGIPVDTTAAAITSTRAAAILQRMLIRTWPVLPSLRDRRGLMILFMSLLLWTLPRRSVGAARQVYLGAEVRSRAEHELELKEKLRAKYAARGRLLEKKDLEILRLKSQLSEKEAEAAEVIRLRDQVSSLSREKSALTAEVSVLKMTVTQKDHDISLLDSRVAYLASTLDDAKVACAEAGDKITSLASERDRLASEGTLGHALGWSVDFGVQEGLEAGYEHGTAERNLSVVDAYNPEAAKASYIDAVKDLKDVDFPLVNLLKSKKDAKMDELSIPIYHEGDKTTVGETSLSFALMNVHARAAGARKHAADLRQLMMEIVSAPLSSQTWVGKASTSVGPLSVEDYDEEDTDEALGSVVAIPKLETCRF
ncbi:hypothetical protein Tco_1070173 [Tanacetum coccineum]|uniref:Uncharacterized protein n=1 Tax=Tanacetum coccineum TaxID=301880 RepID=A0ABQ5HKS0_9ASTR